MDKTKWHKILADYIPQQAIDYVIELFEKYPVQMVITRERQTKHGDFRYQTGRTPKITVNHNLNSYAFLITLIHEMAHYTTFQQYKRSVLPHGNEWKNEFRMLMLPLLNNAVFPDELLSILAQHLRNPKASSNSDAALFFALKKYDAFRQGSFLNELSLGEKFVFQNRTFVVEEKRRTRYLCMDTLSKKKYLIHQNAEIEKV